MLTPRHSKSNRSTSTSFFLGLCLLSILFFPLVTFLGAHIAKAQTISLDQGEGSYVYPVRLELKVLNSETKVNGSTIIENKPNIPYTTIETTYTVRARAFGGDVYLPAYREDIVSSADITEPQEGTNALVAGLPSIEILKKLPKVDDKFLLKEYEEVNLKIKISFKVVPTAMPPRLVFAPRLDTVLWYPTVYENGQNDPGISPETGERLVNIPLIKATYVPQQVTRVDAKGDSVILIKGGKVLTEVKDSIKSSGGLANVMSIFRRIFLK